MPAGEATGGETWYDVLGAAPEMGADELRKHYHARALQLHPDKNPGDAAAASAFQRVQSAWSVLGDAAARAAYDAAQAVTAGNRISEEVDLDDLHFEPAAAGAGGAAGEEEEEEEAAAEDRYTWPCRCGENFTVTMSMLEEGCDVFGCDGCSLCIRVMYELASASDGEGQT